MPKLQKQSKSNNQLYMNIPKNIKEQMKLEAGDVLSVVGLDTKSQTITFKCISKGV